MPEIELAVEFPETTEELILEYVRKSGLYNPAAVVIDSPVAFYLEHGTGPAQQREARREDGRNAYERIGAWTESRFKQYSGDRLERKKNAMYDKIMKVGTPPRPFIRPAIQDVLSDSSLVQDCLKRVPDGLAELAQAIVDRMLYYLVDINKSVSSDDVDSLFGKIYVDMKYMQSDSEGLGAESQTLDDILKEWEALDNEMQNKYNTNLGNYYREKQRKRGMR